MRLSPKESRMLLLNATNLDRKSGIRGPKTTGRSPIKALSFHLFQQLIPVFNTPTPLYSTHWLVNLTEVVEPTKTRQTASCTIHGNVVVLKSCSKQWSR